MDLSPERVVPGPFPFRVEVEQILRRVRDVQDDLLAERQKDLDRGAGRERVIGDGFVEVAVVDVGVVAGVRQT